MGVWLQAVLQLRNRVSLLVTLSLVPWPHSPGILTAPMLKPVHRASQQGPHASKSQEGSCQGRGRCAAPWVWHTGGSGGVGSDRKGPLSSSSSSKDHTPAACGDWTRAFHIPLWRSLPLQPGWSRVSSLSSHPGSGGAACGRGTNLEDFTSPVLATVCAREGAGGRASTGGARSRRPSHVRCGRGVGVGTPSPLPVSPLRPLCLPDRPRRPAPGWT